jgi:hypothetical protein
MTKKEKKIECILCHKKVNESAIDIHCINSHKMNYEQCIRYAMIKHSHLSCDVVPMSEFDFIQWILDNVVKLNEHQKLVFWLSMMFHQPVYKSLKKATGL